MFDSFQDNLETRLESKDSGQINLIFEFSVKQDKTTLNLALNWIEYLIRKDEKNVTFSNQK